MLYSFQDKLWNRIVQSLIKSNIINYLILCTNAIFNVLPRRAAGFKASCILAIFYAFLQYVLA